MGMVPAGTCSLISGRRGIGIEKENFNLKLFLLHKQGHAI